MRLRKEKNNFDGKNQHLLVGSLFIVIGFVIITSKYYYNYKLNKQDDTKVEEFMEAQQEIESVGVVNSEFENKGDIYERKEIVTEYLAVLEIPKLGIKKGVYSKNSSLNNVNKNIEIMEESDMPNQENGNFILAGHSGNGRTAYFKKLYKLENNDIAYIYYDGGRYAYKLINKYDIDKTGEANIVRNSKKRTLTLITCKNNSNKQTIYIFELLKEGE